jgi:hypothetical protein
MQTTSSPGSLAEQSPTTRTTLGSLRKGVFHQSPSFILCPAFDIDPRTFESAQSAAVEAKSPYVSRGQGDSPVAGKQRSKPQNLRRGQSQPTPGQVPRLSLGETYPLTTGQTPQLTQGQPSQSTQEQPSQPAQGQNPQHNQDQSHQTPQGTGGQNPPANPTQRTRARAQTATSGTTAES